ncbi:GGDEF domain-containing protein [Collimonas arenae]|uniref:GGDEF domain-containing protein n=1 Tax=Collimonas arenae TaxID=279058 RepID=UPI0007785CAE|nr:GGDEF domain-containing protein [Collimonas arenae]
MLIALFLTLIGKIVDGEWTTYQRGRNSIPAIKQFQLALRVEEKLSAERGPNNILLGQNLSDSADARAKLAQARAATDQSLSILLQAMRSQEDLWFTPLIANVKATTLNLALARQQVDLLAAKPKSERDADSVSVSVEMMVATVEIFSSTIGSLSNRVILADPQFHDGVESAQLSSRLRDIAGQVGSTFTAPVIAKRPLTPQEIYAFARLTGQADQLYSVIELELRSYYKNPAFKIALDNIRTHYFGDGVDFLNGLFAAGRTSGNYGLSSGDIAAIYVPMMSSIPELRELIVAELIQEAESRNQRAGYFLLATILLGIVAIGIFVMLIRLIRQRVLRPILDATELFVSFANERFETAIPEHLYNDEIGEMLRAIRVLKAHSLDKIRLEKEREELIKRLRASSDTDFLTGLLNRRAFYAQGEQQFGITRRYQRQMVVILMDVDHFKAVNDMHGHQAGDRVLCDVAELCRHERRKVDLLARYGGEEFLLLLPEIDLLQGIAVAEKLRAAIDAHLFQLDDGVVLKISASFGVASFEDDDNLESLIARADQKLYAAKNAGRNKVMPARQVNEFVVA